MTSYSSTYRQLFAPLFINNQVFQVINVSISAGYKQIKCLLLSYIVFTFLLFVVCLVGGLLAYIFRTQVVTTIQAEMIADIRSYDPASPEAPVTRAWDVTQERLQCCGLMTEKVTQSWQMWRFNRILNPGGVDSLVVPRSCCVTDKVGS